MRSPIEFERWSALVKDCDMRTSLVVSGSKRVVKAIQSALSATDRVDGATTVEIALKKLEAKQYDILFIDLPLMMTRLNDGGFEAAFDPFKTLSPTIEIIVISPRDQIKQAVEALRAGAREYLTDSFLPEELRLVVEGIRSAIVERSELDFLRDQFWRIDAREVVFTNNDKMEDVFKKVKSVAPTKATVLLLGETGTGKGVMARLIHQHSPRHKSQFISVHCGAIPETLIESELFGHEKGAFTGAIRRKLGKFEIARGGTIFLDEIATITPSAQIKLLQVLQDGTFSRVGCEDNQNTDARVVAATNADLKQMADENRFRKDLFYRLNVFPIEIPPLRDHIEDIPLFVEYNLNKLNLSYQKQVVGAKIEVIQALQRYNWPGNVRELENLIERAYILEKTDQLSPESFPIELFQSEEPLAVLPLDSCFPLAKARKRALEAFEHQYLKHLLTRNRGMIKRSADEAGVTTRQINKLMARYGFRKEDFKT
jgi:DNA-binding NtrC family response regulator